MRVEVVGDLDSERRSNNALSVERASNIMDALEVAQAELEAKRDSFRSRFLRWVSDAVGIGYRDISVSCNFRRDDAAGEIRELFIDSSKLSEAEVLGGLMGCDSGRLSDDSTEVIKDEFLEVRGDVLADLAEILFRAGILPYLREVEDGEDVIFSEGHVYKMKIGGKWIFAFCSGFTDGDQYFSGDYKLSAGVPVFQFSPGAKFDSNGRYSRYVIGKIYIRQEPEHDIFEEFCGYARNGEPVMKFLRKEPVGGFGKETDVRFDAGISS